MKKSSKKTIFRCQKCGYGSPKWFGRCPECDSWNTSIPEEQIPLGAHVRNRLGEFSSEVVNLDKISIAKVKRLMTGIKEFDRIVGGGIMPASIVLLGGPPGIGKSTLMLQVANRLPSKLNTNGKAISVLYVSGEESLEQIKIRAERLNLPLVESFYVLSEVNLEKIFEVVKKISPDVLVIDSIQTIYMSDIASAPGSVGQVRECSSELQRLAKNNKITVFILGHITKGGDIAGPMILEHIVDTVLYFDTEEHHTYRILRVHKNRFGPTSELGVFEMKSDGLNEVPNPSMFFLSERIKDTPGSSIVTTIEGTRALLLEIQALITKTNFGLPRRMVTGLDYNRTVLLIAVLEKRLGLPLESYDVFINVAGGMRVKEPGVDLGVCVSIFGAYTNKLFPNNISFIGEVGLAGEIRAVGYIRERIAESEKLGFEKIFVPMFNMRGLDYSGKAQLLPVENLNQVIEKLGNKVSS